jgi:sec-independent protein translocase protein TatB
MFDISWTEFALIGVVALVFIGPKELPAVMRTIGQYTRKVRSMAADFQNQFQEAMREAEMADLKKQVDDIKNTSFDPLKDVRDDLNAMGKDLQSSFDAKPAPEVKPEAAAPDPAAPEPVNPEPATPEPAASEPASLQPASLQPASAEPATAAPLEPPAATADAEAAPAGEAITPESTGRTA